MLVDSGAAAIRWAPALPKGDDDAQNICHRQVLPFLAFPGLAAADTSLGIRGGTLGGGVELSYALSQRAAVRLNADGYTASKRAPGTVSTTT